MKKRIVALLLCCVMLLTLSPSLIASASADDENTVIEQTEEPKNEEPKAEEPKTEEPKTEEPKTEEPKTEEPKTEEPKTEEPKTEEPKTEEPKTEEPKAEEPADPEAPTAPEEPTVPEEGEETGDGIISFTNIAPLVSGAAPMLKTMRAAAQANDETTSSGVELKKSVTEAKDGEYKITLEAYATGSSEMSSTSTPVDIVLVLDVSGSMKENFGSGKNKMQKIVALKNSVNNFIDSVHDKSPDSKIAIVKFAEDTYYDDQNHLAEGNHRTDHFGYNYTEVLKNFQPMTEANASTFKTAVNGLQKGGATAADYGMTLAKELLNQSNIKNDGRTKVVVMFTDGEPNHSNGFSNSVAGNAISTSKSIKDMGATVYTIGIFKKANGSPIPDEKQWNNLSKTNQYMHLVSSNYPKASGWNTDIWGSVDYPGESAHPDNSDKKSSYFLSPSNADELDKVFQAIANEAISGVNQALGSSAYILDTVTEYFDVPTGTDAIRYSVAKCTGKNADGLTFGTPTAASGVSGEFTDKTLKVSGFDFKENWCGSKIDLQGNTTYRGQKLIIEFTVKVRDGFLGGNNVPTNVGKTDGIYDKDGKLVDEFPLPAGVDVKIPDITVTAQDKNVYLLGRLTADDLMAGAEAKYGTTDILGYGVDAWEDDYVTITSSAGNNFTGLTDDTTYTLTVKVEPKNKEGTVGAKSTTSEKASINVFTPVVTFKDSQITLGESADYTKNLDGVVWKHGEVESTTVTMIGEKPELKYGYNPAAGIFKTDTPVTATVKIEDTDVTGKVAFKHAVCTIKDKCTLDAEDGHFIVHVKPLSLTIKKTGADSRDANQSFVFVVSNSRNDSLKISGLEVIVHGNDSVTLNGLPTGTYTVTEKESWSWRYQPTKNNQEVKLTAADGSVTFTNTRSNPYWLTGGTWCDNRFDGKDTRFTPTTSASN